MVREIAERFGVKPESIPLIGDSLRDLQAVAEVGGQPILVKTGKGVKTLQNGGLPDGTLVFEDLYAAAAYLIDRS
jgi:D-glycero-D-manno-heptose 1,7-bisphosphate phosphatase